VRIGVVKGAAVLCLGWGLLVAGTPVRAQSVSDLESSDELTPQNLVDMLIGGGVTISNVTYTGAPRAAGVFESGMDAIGFQSGIVLSSGNVQTREGDALCSGGVEGPNECLETTLPAPTALTQAFGTPGDVQLDELSGFPTQDAAVLEFDFVPRFSTIQFRYVFASEEYNDFVHTQFNDVFGFYVNGVNCALVPDTQDPVSINTINNGNPNGDPAPRNPELFRDNVRPEPTLPTEFDGLTTILTCDAIVEPGVVNHMKLAISDASDALLDSAVFIDAGSFVSGTAIQTELRGAEQVGSRIEVQAGTAVTDHANLMGVNAANATGAVTYTVYSDAACTNVFAEAGLVAVDGAVVPESIPVVFEQPGTYYWVASYTGDDVNNASAGECGDEVVTVTPRPGSSNCKVKYLGLTYPGKGKYAKVAGFAWARDGKLIGKHFYAGFFRHHGFWLKSLHSESLTCSEGEATLEGEAWLGLERVHYRIELVDRGYGRGVDSYRLKLSNGFDSGTHRVFFGGVLVHPLDATPHAGH